MTLSIDGEQLNNEIPRVLILMQGNIVGHTSRYHINMQFMFVTIWVNQYQDQANQVKRIFVSVSISISSRFSTSLSMKIHSKRVIFFYLAVQFKAHLVREHQALWIVSCIWKVRGCFTWLHYVVNNVIAMKLFLTWFWFISFIYTRRKLIICWCTHDFGYA